MITEFKNTKMRDSGVIYNSTLEQIKKLYSSGQTELAGELAISAIELVLTGETSSDNIMIEIMLEPLKAVREKDKAKYDKRTEAKRQKEMEELELVKIAELHKRGYKQKAIAEEIGTTQQTISYRLGKIRTDYPELLSENFTNDTNNTKKTTYDNDNDTVNDNDNVNKVSYCATAQNAPKGEKKEFKF